MSNADHAAAAFIRSLLEGHSPNGQPLEGFGAWRDVAEALALAQTKGGISAVRATWLDITRRHPELAALVSRDEAEPLSLEEGTSPEADEAFTPPVWPVLEDQALYGLAGDVVRTISPHTEADPVAILMQTLVTFGNVIGRQPHCMAEADYHAMNENAVLVGPTSKARKGTSAGQVRRLYTRVEPLWAGQCIQEGLSSGEGLIWAVRDPITKREAIREKGKPTGAYQDVLMDEGVRDKRLLILEAEFASTLRVLGREGNTLSAIIRRAWDSGELKVLTKNSPAEATGAHISIVGHITRDELLRYLDSTESGNGFGNRFLWCCVRRSQALPEGGHLEEAELTGLVMRLRKAIDAAAYVHEIKRDPEARALRGHDLTR